MMHYLELAKKTVLAMFIFIYLYSFSRCFYPIIINSIHEFNLNSSNSHTNHHLYSEYYRFIILEPFVTRLIALGCKMSVFLLNLFWESNLDFSLVAKSHWESGVMWFSEFRFLGLRLWVPRNACACVLINRGVCLFFYVTPLTFIGWRM